jgi:hypothetical protein
MIEAEGEPAYGPVVNLNGVLNNKNSIHEFTFNPDKQPTLQQTANNLQQIARIKQQTANRILETANIKFQIASSLKQTRIINEQTAYYKRLADEIAISNQQAANNKQQFQSGAFSETNYERNDFRGKSNIREEEIKMMTEKARMIQHVYDNTNKYGTQGPLTQNTDRKNYVIPNERFEKFRRYDTGSSLSIVFVDEKDKKVTVAMRGLSISKDNRDRQQFVEMTFASLFPKEVDKGQIADFGALFAADVDHLTDVVNLVRIDFPDYELSIAGHSRAGAAALEVGRRYNIKTYAFNPAGNRREKEREFTGYDPTNINIFTSDQDKIPKYIKENIKFSPETNHMVVNKKAYGIMGFARGHGIHHFIDEPNIYSIRKKTKTILDEKKLNKMLAGGLVSYHIERPDQEPAQKMISYEPKLMLGEPESTSALVADYTKREVFNTYKPSVFNSINRLPEQEFKPIKNLFNLIDTNKDNKITYKEFKSYYKTKGLTDDAILKMFNNYDTNKDKALTKNEFN